MPRRRVFDDQSRRFSWPFSVRKLFPATIVNMSYEKATYTTLDIHEWDCSDGLCGDQYSEPGLNSKEKVSKALELIDKKTKAVGKKMQDVTAEIDRLERALRTVDEDAYNRRSQCLLLAKVTALSGMLHMLLRYTLVLRNDRQGRSFSFTILQTSIPFLIGKPLSTSACSQTVPVSRFPGSTSAPALS